MWRLCAVPVVLLATVLFAQTNQQSQPEGQQAPAWRPLEETKPGDFVIPPGTRIPLSLINSVSTKNSAEGDRVYLETVFPIMANNKIVIPPGSYVMGTVTEVKRPGRIKGRGELYLRFDSLTLPNGITRDFRARVSGLDGSASEQLDRSEGKIKSEGNKTGDARTVGETAAAGVWAGGIAGSVAGHPAAGIGIGAAAGAAAGAMAVLLSRGPDVVLSRGTTLEMVMDRPISYSATDLDFTGVPPRAPQIRAPASQTNSGQNSIPMPGRRFPF